MYGVRSMPDRKKGASRTELSRRKLLKSFGAVGAAMAAGSLGAVIANGPSMAGPPKGSSTVSKNVYASHANPAWRRYPPHVYDVRELGAAGNGSADDTFAFEQALLRVKEDGSGVVYVPPGTYVITRVLRLYPNTFIRMEDGAVLKKMGDPNIVNKLFVNGDIGNPDYAQGYEGDGNITVIGGTIDLCGDTNPPDPGRNLQAFGIAHADNVHIERVNIINGHNGHMIEFNSSRNVKLLNCRFMDQFIRSDGQYEMVQIDFADRDAFPTFGAFDDTPCRDVLIEGCTFINGHRGVGTHGSKYDRSGNQVFHENIRIVNNVFKDFADIAIKPESYRNSVVSGNTIENTGGVAIGVYSCQNTIVSNNTIRQAGLHGITISRKTAAGKFDEPSVHVMLSDNILSDIAYSPFRVIGGLKISITGNSVSNANREGIYATNTNDISIRNNVFRGVCQEQNDKYFAIRAEGCHEVEMAGNSIGNSGYASNYKYGIHIAASNSGVRISGNMIVPGTSGAIRSDAPDTVIVTESGERLLTATLNVSSGSIALNDDITNYKSLIVATGAVSSGDLRHEFVRGWFTSGFRPGTDYLNVATSNGRLIASIDSNRQITVLTASDPLRYIIGIR